MVEYLVIGAMLLVVLAFPILAKFLGKNTSKIKSKPLREALESLISVTVNVVNGISPDVLEKAKKKTDGKLKKKDLTELKQLVIVKTQEQLLNESQEVLQQYLNKEVVAQVIASIGEVLLKNRVDDVDTDLKELLSTVLTDQILIDAIQEYLLDKVMSK